VSVAKKLIFAIAVVMILSGAVICALPAMQFGPPQSQQSEAEREMRDRQIRESNKKRQQDIRDDTEKLFQLSSELKAAVEKSNEHMLSLDVVRKAEEVEKLAKKVKEKMKEAVGPTPRLDNIPTGPVGRPPQ
jgi:membrane protein involved in colicin uptake